ncbi:hypothetical protein NQ318_015069 [Aromia moschata]|uniref:Uncharacterized protein n=1 Tax=Aromia moschata TaxID=1265417 RepID=A0AAV8YZ37_9CUCU|nr:hypothetical protein NQ318_015069 [Aromia moschata]
MQNIQITLSPNPQETGHVKDLPKSGRPKITQDKKIDIVLSMEENPQSTSTLVASENEVSQTTVLFILRKENYHPYKFQLVQELNEDDPDRRLQFCGNILWQGYGKVQKQHTRIPSDRFGRSVCALRGGYRSGHFLLRLVGNVSPLPLGETRFGFNLVGPHHAQNYRWGPTFRPLSVPCLPARPNPLSDILFRRRGVATDPAAEGVASWPYPLTSARPRRAPRLCVSVRELALLLTSPKFTKPLYASKLMSPKIDETGLDFRKIRLMNVGIERAH